MAFPVHYHLELSVMAMDRNNEEGLECRMVFEKTGTIAVSPAGLGMIWFNTLVAYEVEGVHWEDYAGGFFVTLKDSDPRMATSQDDVFGTVMDLKATARREAESCGFKFVSEKLS